ncbi:hypothetical protein [Duncaniella sp. C9]|uniref:hypothetical protein n=1 Tax=Duncaniella sp. C9 TaxID=2530392 RepID=UPI00143D07A2|nr:hypothetical protein [Duncaniella sp. C9]
MRPLTKSALTFADSSSQRKTTEQVRPPVTYSNGETMRQILARSKHTLDDVAEQMD